MGHKLITFSKDKVNDLRFTPLTKRKSLAQDSATI